MKSQERPTVNDELKQFHCSILMEELKERAQKLRAYGVAENDIIFALGQEQVLPRLIVTEDYKFILSGQDEEMVEMEPLVKAVYLLFLSHPEGIVLKTLPDYRNELKSIYQLLRPTGITRKAEKSILDVTNPSLNSINEKCARIRKAFLSILPEDIAQNYMITGKRGEAKKIVLARSSLVWRCEMPYSQGL